MFYAFLLLTKKPRILLNTEVDRRALENLEVARGLKKSGHPIINLTI
jgi:hypothetical protein